MSWVTTLLNPILSIINKIVPDTDKQAQINKEITEVVVGLASAESKSESWLTRTWRPWLMFTMGNFVALWGLHNCVIRPYLMFLYGVSLPVIQLPVEFWNLLGLGFSVYGGARTIEKVVDAFIKHK